MRILSRMVSVLLVVLSFTAATSFAVFAQDKQGEKKDVQVVTQKDHGSKITLKKGQLLQVKLPIRTGTGYIWSVVLINEKILPKQEKEFLEPLKEGKPLPGATRTQVFTFRAEQSGETMLEMHYARPFEKNKKPAEVLKLTVEIQ